MKKMCVVVHDVAPGTWAATRRLLATITQVGTMPVTLLAVPRYHGEQRDPAFEHWLMDRAAGGDEIALHGYRHLDDGEPRGWIDSFTRRTYTRGEGEFSDLSFDEAMLRIDAGLAWLHELGVRPDGFVAPAWLLGPEAWRAVRAQAFRYTCTLRRIHFLDADRMQGHTQERSIACQSQVYSHSTAWRRGMSVIWNDSLAWLQRGQPLVRMELHPADADHAIIKSSWQKNLRAQLDTREVLTLRTLAKAERQSSEQNQYRSRGDPADHRADDHVAGIVQAKHDA
jgi:predicted deacetylase